MNQPSVTSVSTTVALQRGDGSTYLIVERNRAENWIHARWHGPQTLGSIMDGGLTYVEMLRTEPCPKLLNDHTELTGGFTEANSWIEQVWTPLILDAGLRYFAQVLSPDIFGQLATQNLRMRIGEVFEMQMFGSLESAKNWLRAQA